VESRRLEPPLKHVADFVISGVEIARVFSENSVKDFTERAISIRNRDMVDVVVHQSVGPNASVVIKTLRPKKLEINAAVGIVEENIRLPVSAVKDVIRIS